MNPGLGIAMAILTVPAMLRTVLVAFRRREGGQPMSVGSKAGIFILTLAMTVSVIVAASAAFFFTCLISAQGSLDRLPVGLTLGGIMGLVVGVGLTWGFWQALRNSRKR